MSVRFPLENYKEFQVGFPGDIIPKRFCLYKITNKANNRFYIGKHLYDATPFDEYSGSGVLIAKAYKKYGVEVFEKEILEYNVEESEIDDLEKTYIKKYKKLYPTLCYNIAPGGTGGITYIGDNPRKGWKPSAETRRRMSESQLGKTPWNKGMKYTPEMRKRISDGVRKSEKAGYQLDESYREKCRQAHINSPNNKGSNHYAYNKIMINNGSIQQYIDKNSEIPSGWVKGRICKKTNPGKRRSDKDRYSIRQGRLLSRAIEELVRLRNPEEKRCWRNLGLKEDYNISNDEINNFAACIYVRSSFLPSVMLESGTRLYSEYYQFCKTHNLFEGTIRYFHPWHSQNSELVKSYALSSGYDIPKYITRVELEEHLNEFFRKSDYRIPFEEVISFLNTECSGLLNTELFEKEKPRLKELLSIDYAALWEECRSKNRTINRENL